MTFRVFQVDDSPGLAPYAVEREGLAAAGGELVPGVCVTEDDIIATAGAAEVLWLAWEPNITRRVLAGLPSVRLAIRWGVGFEQIDTAGATELGVAVANAPTYGTDDVAEHALALLLTVSRHTAWRHEEMRRGEWPPSVPGTVHRLKGKTLGVIGCGRIGSAFARKASGLGMRIIGTDIVRTPAELAESGIEAVDIDILVADSDYISVHVPYSAGTHHLVGTELLARSRPGAVIVNTSRGRVIDTDALVAALASGHVAAAGLDVFETEPLPEDSPLRALPNVVLTPHSAGYSDEAMVDLRLEMVRTTVDFMTTGWATTIVNPEVHGRLRG